MGRASDKDDDNDFDLVSLSQPNFTKFFLFTQENLRKIRVSLF